MWEIASASAEGQDNAYHKEGRRSGAKPLMTVASIMTHVFHKILTSHFTHLVVLNPKQKAFLLRDGCTENIFHLDLILNYHRQHFKPLYMACMNIAKAFDSVSHKTIEEILNMKGLLLPMTS
ncbi:hypothetical protein QLX08_005895 [Tetragonisca angustula]|uniref:Reverse transcriptase domain-containing protein n=1 Tax=Tetragonisca angustula TaxID=166442 RepID=A0AAW0ZVX4_9HYME